MDSQASLYRERFGDKVISFTPYAFKKMGLVQAQTTLKIDVYTLICVPFRISFSGVALLVSFTQEEMVFFQRFKGSLSSLTVIFQASPNLAPLKLFARCSLTGVSPVKNRPNVALVSLDFKPCPDDLVKVLGDYLSALEQMKTEYDEHKGTPVNLSPATAKTLGYNDYAVLICSSGQRRFRLFSLSTDTIQMLFPSAGPDIPPPGSDCAAKLYFKSYRFTANGMIVESNRMPSGILKAAMKVDFTPELSDILSGYYVSDLFKRSLGRRG